MVLGKRLNKILLDFFLVLFYVYMIIKFDNVYFCLFLKVIFVKKWIRYDFIENGKFINK